MANTSREPPEHSSGEGSTRELSHELPPVPEQGPQTPEQTFTPEFGSLGPDQLRKYVLPLGLILLGLIFFHGGVSLPFTVHPWIIRVYWLVVAGVSGYHMLTRRSGESEQDRPAWVKLTGTTLTILLVIALVHFGLWATNRQFFSNYLHHDFWRLAGVEAFLLLAAILGGQLKRNAWAVVAVLAAIIFFRAGAVSIAQVPAGLREIPMSIHELSQKEGCLKGDFSFSPSHPGFSRFRIKLEKGDLVGFRTTGRYTMELPEDPEDPKVWINTAGTGEDPAGFGAPWQFNYPKDFGAPILSLHLSDWFHVGKEVVFEMTETTFEFFIGVNERTDEDIRWADNEGRPIDVEMFVVRANGRFGEQLDLVQMTGSTSGRSCSTRSAAPGG